MGGLLHLFDFNQSNTSRKSLSTKKQDGLEAPRNSLEMPIETIHSYDAVGENIPHSYQVVQNSKNKNSYPSGAPMKSLIDEEISKEPTRRNVPSVVARLMGMDTLPADTRPLTVHLKTKKDDITVNNFVSKDQPKSISVRRSPLGLKHSKQTEDHLPSQSIESDPDQSWNTFKSEKPRPREHPQEEQLQKFKKDFEAWQAARVWEHPKVVEPGSMPRQWLAREDLNKEKTTFSADAKKMTPKVKSIKHEGHTPLPVMKISSQEKSELRHNNGYNKESVQSVRKETGPMRSRTRSNEVEQGYSNSPDEHGKSSAPTRIVILKPGPDTGASHGESSWASSSEIVEEGVSIEDFLEEVKERLRFEMQGKSVKRDTVVRGSGIETPFNEKPSNPRQIARHIANQVRESVTRDLGMNLTRSESTRSYRSEMQVNGPGSPEFIDRGTRKLLSQRLRNVLTEDRHTIMECGLRPLHGSVGEGYWDNVKTETELQSSSFRYGQKNDVLSMGDMSPRNLVRSMSAPVSGTSFGKLLLEDRHVLTGAHIRRRQEATENVLVDERKTRKERHSFKGKVSNLKYKFTFKSNLFSRKMQSVEEAWSNESDSMNDIMSGPTVVANLGSAQENSTEVPPSPASVCSSSHEEFYRTAEHPSPISTLDVPMIENHVVPKVFRDLSSNLNELRRQLKHLEFGTSDDMEKLEEPQGVEMVVLGPAEAYIKNLLIVSGLYDGSSDQSFSRWDLFAKPLSNRVYEKVEETYSKGTEEEIGSTKDLSESKIDHKLLFDLSNEALSVILRPCATMSTFKRKVNCATMMPPPRRKELLDRIWNMISIYIHPPCDVSFYSLDSMVSEDLRMDPWLSMVHNDVDIIGKDIEKLILGKLIEETVRDIWI
ncbi:Rb1-inducible coiled-coil protein [Thalictrum thalictroides]|uniref:Rb1-inducible coiled-coil protein n=1 Tax=Thalictrum thalictroides TaxID=46969 RepID=A0A7J6W0V4_THATH|nr:Rb1-inducible coiled-coil protein [Thalictrum thalictroides]